MEIERGGNPGFGVAELKAAEFLHRLLSKRVVGFALSQERK